jgi:two-component system response regulator RegA
VIKMPGRSPQTADDERSTLLLVDDDDAFRRVLARALDRRGYAVSVAATVAAAIVKAQAQSPEYAVVDLRMPGQSGLVLIEKLLELDPNTRIVMLTGYASIATAIEAIKLGAVHYLAKPCDADEIVAALNKSSGGDSAIPVTGSPLSIDRLEWEHIQRVLVEQQAMSRQPPEPSKCIAARCSASSANTRAGSSHEQHRTGGTGAHADRQVAVGGALLQDAVTGRTGRCRRPRPARRAHAQTCARDTLR